MVMNRFDEITDGLTPEETARMLTATLHLKKFAERAKEATNDPRVSMPTIIVSEETLKMFGSSEDVINYANSAYPDDAGTFTNGDAINHYIDDLNFVKGRLVKFIKRSIEEEL